MTKGVDVGSKRKLIEVSLPLEVINRESAREKSTRHGHPSTLHLWWARRPLAAARAVIFAQMVDDPSSRPDLFPTAAKQDKERHLTCIKDDIAGRQRLRAASCCHARQWALATTGVAS